jgi:hypothetical protein
VFGIQSQGKDVPSVEAFAIWGHDMKGGNLILCRKVQWMGLEYGKLDSKTHLGSQIAQAD